MQIVNDPKKLNEVFKFQTNWVFASTFNTYVFDNIIDNSNYLFGKICLKSFRKTFQIKRISLSILHQTIMLSSVSCIKDLDVFIDCNLSFSKHIDDITRRTYQRMYMIYKGFVSRDKTMLCKSYTTYVSPLLENCTQIWSPTYVTDIVIIEKVQKYFIRRISSISNLSYKRRRQWLKLDTLELRKLYC